MIYYEEKSKKGHNVFPTLIFYASRVSILFSLWTVSQSYKGIIILGVSEMNENVISTFTLKHKFTHGDWDWKGLPENLGYWYFWGSFGYVGLMVLWHFSRVSTIKLDEENGSFRKKCKSTKQILVVPFKWTVCLAGLDIGASSCQRFLEHCWDVLGILIKNVNAVWGEVKVFASSSSSTSYIISEEWREHHRSYFLCGSWSRKCLSLWLFSCGSLLRPASNWQKWRMHLIRSSLSTCAQKLVWLRFLVGLTLQRFVLIHTLRRQVWSLFLSSFWVCSSRYRYYSWMLWLL